MLHNIRHVLERVRAFLAPRTASRHRAVLVPCPSPAPVARPAVPAPAPAAVDSPTLELRVPTGPVLWAEEVIVRPYVLLFEQERERQRQRRKERAQRQRRRALVMALDGVDIEPLRVHGGVHR